MSECAKVSRRRFAVAVLLRSVFIGSALFIPQPALAFGLSADDLEGSIEFLNDANTAYQTGRRCLSENLGEDKGFCDREATKKAVDIAADKLGEKAEETTQKAVVKGIGKLAKKVGWKGAVKAAKAATKALPAVSQLVTAGEFGAKVGELVYNNVVEPYLEERYAEGEKRRNVQVLEETAFMKTNKDVAKEFLRRQGSDGRKAADAYLADKMREAALDAQRLRTSNTLDGPGGTREMGDAAGIRTEEDRFASAVNKNSDFLSPDDELFLRGDDASFPLNALDGEGDDTPVSDISGHMDTFQSDAEERYRKEQARNRNHEREIAAAIRDRTMQKNLQLQQNIAELRARSVTPRGWIRDCVAPRNKEWRVGQGSRGGECAGSGTASPSHRSDSSRGSSSHLGGRPNVREQHVDDCRDLDGKFEAMLRDAGFGVSSSVVVRNWCLCFDEDEIVDASEVQCIADLLDSHFMP